MSFDHRPQRQRSAGKFWGCVLLALAIALAGLAGGRAATPTFFPDDPIQVDDDRAFDARDVDPIEGSNAYDFAEHTFFKPGDRRDIRAVNVNTLDEVPDSTWFTNRIGRGPMSIEELVRGPNQFDTLNVDDWPIVQEKSSGITPGYRLTDPSGAFKFKVQKSKFKDQRRSLNFDF